MNQFEIQQTLAALGTGTHLRFARPQADQSDGNRGTSLWMTNNRRPDLAYPCEGADMTTSGRVTRRLGQWGEDAAVRHLQERGWVILDRNWRCAIGEVDIVARDPSPGADGTGVQLVGDTVVFVEVKCRSGLGFGDPLEAITQAKLGKLRELSALWLRAHQVRPARIRLDAIGVLRIRGRGVEVTHIQGITS